MQQYMLIAEEGLPAGVYLYLDYDPSTIALDTVELAPGREDDFLLLTIAHRQPGVAIVALARIGVPEELPPLDAGPLVSLRFCHGTERVYKSASEVNTDPSSASVLELATASGGPLLRWTERNIGDYDNNSLVGAPDITPIAMHYLEMVAASPIAEELALIDGDSNGEIGSADIVPIGRNFDRSINGFNVYRATGATPSQEDFTLLGNSPTISRASVWADASPSERHRALVYEYEPAAAEGMNTYYVEAWATDGSTGLASNQVQYTMQPSNLPPVWDTTVEITSLTPAATGLRLTFGSAIDPEGGEVGYLLRYVQGSAADLSGPGAQEQVLTAAELGDTPPFAYTLALSLRSAIYTMTLQAQDEQGARTDVMQRFSCYLPGLAFSSDTWGYYRADAQRTGCNPAAGPREPMGLAWQAALGLDGASEPVVSSAGWTAVSKGGGQIARYDIADGADAGALSGGFTIVPLSLSLDGTRVVQGAANGAALLWCGAVPGVMQLTSVPGQTAPLLLGEYIIMADASGTVNAWTTQDSVTANPAWSASLGSQPTDGGCLAPASDGESVYVGLTGGKLYKLNALSGEEEANGNAGAILAGDSLALDSANGQLYLATASDMLAEYALDTLTVENHWPLAAGETATAAPVLVLHETPPLALCPLAVHGSGDPTGMLAAIDLNTGVEAWRYDAGAGVDMSRVSAGIDRVYVNTGAELTVLDYSGRLRQIVAGITGTAHSSPALAEDALVQVSGAELSALAAVADIPPQWVGIKGIKSLRVVGNDLEVAWNYATEPQGEPVFYAIYYAAGAPPSFDPPYTGTAVVPGIQHTGTEHTYTLTDLEPGTRYYVGVRAYDGYWDDGPTLEGNTNYLAATPPWQREELLLGDGLDLPDGEVYFIRGLTDPSGVLHLVYSQREDAALTHVWGAVGAWQHEGPSLGAHTASTFDLAWDDELVIAWGTFSQFGLLRRTGPDTWAEETTQFATAIPPVNPQVSLAIGNDPAVVFTEFVDGTFPEIDLDYYAMQADSDVWGTPYVLDALNYAGRDIDLVLDPSALAHLWAAYQRGGNNAPDRPTPMAGECAYAWGDGADGFALDVLDSGDNAPGSDCGKRVLQMLDGAGQPHLAYFDLNSSSEDPRGQLKYAYWTGSAWNVETITGFDLSFQTGSNQFTYGELGFALDGSGRAVVSYLARQTWASQVNSPHMVRCYVWVRELDGTWRSEQLADNEQVFPRDREPCVLQITPDGVWHVFYATSQDPTVPQPVADKIVHYWRPAP